MQNTGSELENELEKERGQEKIVKNFYRADKQAIL